MKTFASFNTDYYQFTMCIAYLYANKANETTGFESFFRHIKEEVNPEKTHYIFSGEKQIHEFMAQVKKEIKDPLYFDSFWNIVSQSIEDKKRIYKITKKAFKKMRKNFKYTVLPEGSIVKPLVPVFQFKGPKFIGQMIETHVTNIINGRTGFETYKNYGTKEEISFLSNVIFHPESDDFKTYMTEIDNITKKFRSVTNKPILEAGYRRAASFEIAKQTSAICIKNGWNGSSNVAAYQEGLIPHKTIGGTMAHAFVMSFESEIEAFKIWDEVFKKSTFLVDTYDTLEAVKTIIKENLKPGTIRIDSEPLKELSIAARKILNDAKWTDVKIFPSGDMTETIVEEFEKEEIPFDITMAGTKIVNHGLGVHINPGFVYKIVEYTKDGKTYFPEKKASNKTNYPGLKDIEVSEAGDIFMKINTGSFGFKNVNNMTKNSNVYFEKI